MRTPTVAPVLVKVLVPVLLAALSCSALARAETRYTLDLARKVVGLGSPRVSPDGRSIAFLVTRPNFDQDRNESELWLADAANGNARALTFERHTVAGPQWSPDGASIAFLAPDDQAQAQVWILPLRGGEAKRLTHSPTGVEHFSWRPDGGAVAYAAADTLPARQGEARHLATFHVGDQDLFLRKELTPQHIWVQPLEGEPRRLTSGSWSLEFQLPPGSAPSHLAWSPDGKQIAFARVPAPESGRLDSVSVAVIDVASRAS